MKHHTRHQHSTLFISEYLKIKQISQHLLKIKINYLIKHAHSRIRSF